MKIGDVFALVVKRGVVYQATRADNNVGPYAKLARLFAVVHMLNLRLGQGLKRNKGTDERLNFVSTFCSSTE